MEQNTENSKLKIGQNVQALAPLVAGNVERGSDSEPKNDTDGTPLPAVAQQRLVLPEEVLE